MTLETLPDQTAQLLSSLGLERENSGAFDGSWIDTRGERVESLNPATGEPIAAVRLATGDDYERCAQVTLEAFLEWRTWPAPKRGEIVRQLGDELRAHKEELGRLVSLEIGKILSEGLGEVQEMIDIATSRSACRASSTASRCTASARSTACTSSGTRSGPVGIITAFNFPVAVWAWNAVLAAVCGDTMIWKPSHQTPLTAVAVQHDRRAGAARRNGAPAIFNLVIGGRTGGRRAHGRRPAAAR